MDYDSTVLAGNVARLRAARGLTQEQLAAKARLVRITIIRVERGTDPPASTLLALAGALDTTTSLLLGERKPPRRAPRRRALSSTG